MSLLSKLLGRKPETSANFAAEIDARKVALSEAHARVSAAASARVASLNALDEDGMARADGEASDAARAVELGIKALEILKAAHAKAVEAEKAEARATALAVLIERRRVLGRRLESEYRAATATMASVLSALAELQRDVAEGGFDREVERSPEISRSLAMHDEAASNVSTWLGDALSSRPTVPESTKEASVRESMAESDRKRAERKAESDRKAEEGRQRHLASREAEDVKARERERYPLYPTFEGHSDAAR